MTISKAQYDKIMATRARPITNPFMNVSRAESERFNAAAINPTDDTADVLKQMIRERRRRNAADQRITVAGERRPKPECGTEQGYQRHRYNHEKCDECRLAHNAHNVMTDMKLVKGDKK